MKRFENKVCLVTGASSGIGKATALAFAKEGGKVIATDINEELGSQTVEEIKALGTEAVFVKCNIAERDDVIASVNAAVEHFGRLDYAVNVAGVAGNTSKPTHEYPEDQWHHQIAVNLTGTWYCLKYQAAQMLKNGGGNIVCVSSAAGLYGQPENSPYAASKHGVVGLVKTAAIEYATQNIRVNAICPTAIETPMLMHGRRNLAENHEAREKAINHQRMKRMGQPEEIADIALYFCSDQSSFLTGQAIAADGGAFA
ncbi:MAG: hypothetical protein CL843_07550 [Crocinitomicaceae bacterium]|nr:hypothetical protein [Crocinitomicaceae bacterium]|tara:strand:- start:3173 stop:3940 length:768 start_codon:yes stop_codon:yes gene_type:complete